MTKSLSLSLFIALAALLNSGCETDRRFAHETEYLGGYHGRSAPRPAPSFDTVSYWDGDGVPGKPSILISLSEQHAYFYKSGDLVGVSTISTGREGFNTTTGTFRIIQKDKDHKSSLFGDYIDAQGSVLMKDIDIHKDHKPQGARFDGAKMPYFMRIVGGTGMHAGYLPGYPASHGCIRMPEFMAENFFSNVTVGTPVTIAR